VQIHLLIFHAAPEPLDKDIVPPAAMLQRLANVILIITALTTALALFALCMGIDRFLGS
jgi:hypothetical protein